MSRRTLRFAVLLVLPLLLPGGAWATSNLVLPLPSQFGEIPADTYDQSGARIGDAWIRIDSTDGGGVRLEGQSGIDGADYTRVLVEMEAVEGGVRPVRQESRSFDGQGQAMGVMAIDHVAGVGSCTAAPVDGVPGETQSVDLPDDDRVANVPLNFLFQPLVSGETDQLKFQILLCRGGPRVVNAIAEVVNDSNGAAPGLVQVQYELSLPKLLRKMASRWLPKLSFWFDPAQNGRWAGHQMPLYSKGPTVLVVRDGLAPGMLLTAH